MAVLERVAHFLGRRDEVPNQELARDLARRRDRAGIREIVAGLHHAERGVPADCIKVLYEIGAIDPKLVAPHAEEFLALLRSRDNRLVWGGMTALSSIAAEVPGMLYAQRDAILAAMERGSVITVDHGVRCLSTVAASDPRRRRVLLPLLLERLRTCRPKDVPQHAEHIARAVGDGDAPAFVALLEGRLAGAPPSRAARLRRLLRSVAAPAAAAPKPPRRAR
jgi:hypothetical protein